MKFEKNFKKRYILSIVELNEGSQYQSQLAHTTNWEEVVECLANLGTNRYWNLKCPNIAPPQFQCNSPLELIEELQHFCVNSSIKLELNIIDVPVFAELNVALCQGRHLIPQATNGSIFPMEIDPLDLVDMAKTISTKLDPIKSHISLINLYVTGLTVALIEAVKYCESNKINLTLYHYNRDTGEYYPQNVFDFLECGCNKNCHCQNW